MKALTFLFSCLLVLVTACASDQEVTCSKIKECLPEFYADAYNNDAATCEARGLMVADVSECANCMGSASCSELETGTACVSECKD